MGKKQRTLLLGLLLAGILAVFARGTTAQVVPENVSVWNKSYSATANILTTSLTSANRGAAQATTFLVVIGIASTASDSVMYLNVVNPGNALPSQNLVLNSGNALSAGYAYTFEFPASYPYAYNFQAATATTIAFLDVDRKVN